MNRGISIWKKDVELFSHPALQEDRCVDAAVIGGGMAGVLTACFLKDSGLKTILLEADEIGRGQTGNTTAKITSQHGLIYDRLIRQFGPERAGLYAAANGWAVEAYGRMIHQQRIDCNFTPCNSYLYTETDERALEQEYEAAEKLGLKAELKTGSEPWRHQAGEPLGLPFAVQAAWKRRRSAPIWAAAWSGIRRRKAGTARAMAPGLTGMESFWISRLCAACVHPGPMTRIRT